MKNSYTWSEEFTSIINITWNIDSGCIWSLLL